MSAHRRLAREGYPPSPKLPHEKICLSGRFPGRVPQTFDRPRGWRLSAARPTLSPQPLAERLLVVAVVAQTLNVRVIVKTTVTERDDVIALRGKPNAAELLARDAQWVGREQARARGLQLAARHPLGRVDFLRPVLAWVLRASACAIAHQDAAAWMAAWLWWCGRHDGPEKENPARVDACGVRAYQRCPVTRSLQLA